MIKICYRCRSRTGSRPDIPWLKRGGKSELHRARCSVTRSPGNGKESATERETTNPSGLERVKRCPSLADSRNRVCAGEVRAHQCNG